MNIYSDANDQFVKSVVAFADKEAGLLYEDEAHKKLLSHEVAEKMLLSGDLLVDLGEDGYSVPTGFKIKDEGIEVTVPNGDSEALTLKSDAVPPSFQITDPPSEQDQFGKVASDLQTPITVTSDHKIFANLHHIEGYTGFSSIEEEQEGHYLATHYVPTPSDAEIWVYKTFGTVGWKKLSRPDLTMVSRITNKYAQKLLVYAERNGVKSDVVEVDLSGLTLEK